MADQKKEITFNRSMIGDKRNPDFCYLRKGIFNSQTPGLYPARDLVRTFPKTPILTTEFILDINGDVNSGLKVIVKEAGANYRFYPLGSDTPSNNSHSGNMVALAYGNGVTNGLYFLDDNDNKIYSINSTNTSIQEVGVLSDGFSSDGIGGFDGLYYWWAGSNIYKQLPGEDPVLVFDNTGFSLLRFMEFYEDQIIFFTQKDNDIYIYFWDKTDTTVFSKRIIIKNSILVGAGIINDTLILVRSIYDYSNQKERKGKLIISAWNGISFKELNSLPMGTGNVGIPSGFLKGINCRCSNEYMLLALYNGNDSTKNEDLYVNYIYKIYKDGSIEVLGNLENGSKNYAHIVAFGLGFNAIAISGDSSNNPKIYTDGDINNDWDNYIDFNNSEYITNFYCNPFNEHQLDTLNVSFEKLFRNGAESSETDEELNIYYRTSDRLDWTLLGNVTAQTIIDNVNLRTPNDGTIPLREQRYQITKMPDGSALPRFNEIQFKFLSKKGFSIIGAWFEYSYTTRNKVK